MCAFLANLNHACPHAQGTPRSMIGGSSEIRRGGSPEIRGGSADRTTGGSAKSLGNPRPGGPAGLETLPSRCRTSVPMRRGHAADLPTRISGRALPGGAGRQCPQVPGPPPPLTLRRRLSVGREHSSRASTPLGSAWGRTAGAGSFAGANLFTPTELSCGVSSAQLRRTACASGPLRGTRGPLSAKNA